MITTIKAYKESIQFSDDRIGVSCAALGSINIDGKFLLLKEDKKFQPIGGGLKYEDSAIPFLQSIGFETDRTDNDIRIKIPKSNWNAFKLWFEKGIDRETTIDREIEEEVGPYMDPSLLRKLNTKPYFNKMVLTDKNRIFQIHQITMDDSLKLDFIDLATRNPNFGLFTKEEVLTRLDIISDHSQYIII